MKPQIIEAPRIALVNCAVLPEPDVDHEPLAKALRARGCHVESLAWDGSKSAESFHVCVLRATWNYYHQPERFLEWVDATARQSRLLNPAPIVRWNADKRYLRELEQQGVPIVETAWFDAGNSANQLEEIAASRHWPRFVIKPVISAASFSTRSFSHDDVGEASAFLAEQLCQRAMMVQPFMASVESIGEKSIAWIDGEITHAWTKRPRFSGQAESVQPTDDISNADRRVVENAIRGCREQILYARIDLMYEESGNPRLSELELIEPSLYFDFSQKALDRFADGVLRCAQEAQGCHVIPGLSPE